MGPIFGGIKQKEFYGSFEELSRNIDKTSELFELVIL